MIRVDSVHAGSTVRFRVMTYDANDALADADSTPSITIYSGEPEFDTVTLAATAMTHAGTGTYDYWWDTTGLSTATYMAVVPTTVDGHKRNNRADIMVLA